MLSEQILATQGLTLTNNEREGIVGEPYEPHFMTCNGCGEEAEKTKSGYCTSCESGEP